MALPWCFLAALLLGACSGDGGERTATAKQEPQGAARAHPPVEGKCEGDILLISADTLRQDHLSLYGYSRPTTPNLDRRFAPEVAAIYSHAYSATASTPQSMISVLSGRLPQDHGVRLFYQPLAAEVPLLPDLLPDCYQSAAFVSNTVLVDEAVGIAHRFDHYDDFPFEREINPEATDRTAAATTRAVLDWLERERDPDRPLFLWVHYMDPHGPYRPPPVWQRTLAPGEPVPIEPRRVPSYLRMRGVDDGEVYVRLYDEEIAYMDAEVEKMLAGYEARYPLDEALLLFTADHGESMMEHEKWFSHGYFIYEEIVRVPLMVRGPGVAPGWRDGLASGVDLAPTALAFAGAPRPEPLPAVDLSSGRGLGPERVIHLETYKLGRHWKGARRGSEKWLAQVMPDGTLTVAHRFDLAADPGELERLAWPKGWSAEAADAANGEHAAMAALLRSIATDPERGGLPEGYDADGLPAEPRDAPPNAAPRVFESLKALGYVG